MFPYEVSKFGFKISAIDPDPNSINHISAIPQINKTYCGNFDEIQLDEKYDLITFNKVLEHVANPIQILMLAKEKIHDNGIIYVELPYSGNSKTNIQYERRTEFNIEHHFVFNHASLEYLISQAKLQVINLENITDPSGKQTIFCFVSA